MTKKRLSEPLSRAPAAAHTSPLATSLIRKPLPRSVGESAPSSNEPRAHAKLQSSDGSVYYMKKYAATFGRGPGVDFVVSNDVAISRVHARIEYSSEEHAFELVVLGKNGAYINGVYVPRGKPPRALSSQTEIVFGKVNPVNLIFLLPCGLGGRGVNHKPQERRPRSLLLLIGAVILGSSEHRLSADEILAELRQRHASFCDSIGPSPILESSVRHALTANRHLFHTHSAKELEISVHSADVEMFRYRDHDKSIPMPSVFKEEPKPAPAAKFSVVEKHAARFLGPEVCRSHGSPASVDFAQ